jgi:hypothetical protein
MEPRTQNLELLPQPSTPRPEGIRLDIFKKIEAIVSWNVRGTTGIDNRQS